MEESPEPERFGTRGTLFLTLALVALLLGGVAVWLMR